MQILGEFQILRKDIQVHFFVTTPSSAESSEDWSKYGGFFKEERKNGKRMESLP